MSRRDSDRHRRCYIRQRHVQESCSGVRLSWRPYRLPAAGDSLKRAIPSNISPSMHFRLRLVHYYAFIVLSLHSYKVNCFLQNFNILFHLMLLFTRLYSARCFRAYFARKSRVTRRETAFYAVSVHREACYCSQGRSFQRGCELTISCR